ncbi:MAG: hypothetical protein IMX01_05610 [Limnochordaceae bacterium]|nr:hypothetical protein [Limnochordaceae bacterium]
MDKNQANRYVIRNPWVYFRLGTHGELLAAGRWVRPAGMGEMPPSYQLAGGINDAQDGAGAAGAGTLAADAPQHRTGPWQLTLAQPDCVIDPTSPGVELIGIRKDSSAGAGQEGWVVEHRVHLGEATNGADHGELRITWSVRLPATADEETLWRVKVENEAEKAMVAAVAFPFVPRVRVRPAQVVGVGVTHETLVYPYFAGLRFDDPVRSLTQPFQGPAGLGVVQARRLPDSRSQYRLEQTYCGQLSMPWMDYSVQLSDGRALGLSLASYDPDQLLTSLRVDVVVPDADEGHHNRVAPATNPATRSGPDWQQADFDLAIVRAFAVSPGQRWQSPPSSVGLHLGDWHWSADRYRRYARPRLGVRRPRPAWLEHSDSLMAHYDFKWQDGTHVHTFADLVPLYQRAQTDGVNHLFVAGWSSGGFDHLYPEYYPDLELGTVMDFVDGVRTIRQAGGQVTFYTNAALFGTDSQYHPTLGQAWAVRQADGSPVQLHFFQKDFTVNCRGAAGYQRQIVDTVCWLVGEAQASGVYLDCFAAIGPYPCYAPEHHHAHPLTWNVDAQRLLAQLDRRLAERGLEPFLMIEGCGDLYAPYLTAGLVHGWYYAHAYPEAYRYTFPEYLGVDMVYPSQGQRFRPAGISALAYDQLHRTFILGHYFWFYDQEDERFCNFRTDPAMWAYVRQVLALRAAVRPFLQQGEFLDDLGVHIRVDSPSTASARPLHQPNSHVHSAAPPPPVAPADPPSSPEPAAKAGWRPYLGEPVVAKRFRLAHPLPPTAFETPLPAGATCGELLAVWVRGDEGEPPHSPQQCEAAARWAADPAHTVELWVEVDPGQYEVWVQTLTQTQESGSTRSTQGSAQRWHPWPAEVKLMTSASASSPEISARLATAPSAPRLVAAEDGTGRRQLLRLPVPASPLSVILLLRRE